MSSSVNRHAISFPFTIHEYRGFGVSEVPTKQPRSALETSSRVAGGVGSSARRGRPRCRRTRSARPVALVTAPRARRRRRPRAISPRLVARLDSAQRASAGEHEVLGRPGPSPGSGAAASWPSRRGRARPRTRTSWLRTIMAATVPLRHALAILGVTGYTGGLVLDEARRAGMPLRLVGRRREALEALARPGRRCALRTRVTWVAARSIRRCDGRRLAAPARSSSSAGARRGAIAVGAHYLDTSGEQAFVRLVHERLEADGGRAARPSASTTSPATWRRAWPQSRSRAHSTRSSSPTRSAARNEPRHAAARSPQSCARSSWPGGRAARAVALRRDDAQGALPVRREDGGRVERHGADHGASAHGCPKVRSYVRAPAVAARLAGSASSSRPFAGSAPFGPRARRRRAAREPLHGRRGGDRRAATGRAVLTGSDVYGLTALLIVRGAQALLAGEARGAGVLAPAEAFDARRSPGGSRRTSGSRSDASGPAAYGPKRAKAPNAERG